MTTDTAACTDAATPAAAPKSPRVDLYAPVHKALRLFMGDTLGRLGWLDLDDADECASTFSQVEALLELCRHHAALENQFIHTAIEARRAGDTARIAAEHDETQEDVAGDAQPAGEALAGRGERFHGVSLLKVPARGSRRERT